MLPPPPPPIIERGWRGIIGIIRFLFSFSIQNEMKSNPFRRVNIQSERVAGRGANKYQNACSKMNDGVAVLLVGIVVLALNF